MDAVTAQLLSGITSDVSKARLLILRGQTIEATVILSDVLGGLAGLERRIMEGRV